MGITGYRRLTWCFAVLSAALLIALAALQHRYAWTMSDIRYGRDIARSFRDRRDSAITRGVTEAASELYSLQTPPGSEPFQNPVADFVERERRRAIADIITFLRAKTGKDLGDAPDPWIREYGDDTIRRLQTNIFESK